MKYSRGAHGRRARYFYFKEKRKAAAAGSQMSPMSSAPCHLDAVGSGSLKRWVGGVPLHRSVAACCVSQCNAQKPAAVPTAGPEPRAAPEPLPTSPGEMWLRVPPRSVGSSAAARAAHQSKARSSVRLLVPGSQGGHSKMTRLNFAS